MLRPHKNPRQQGALARQSRVRDPGAADAARRGLKVKPRNPDRQFGQASCRCAMLWLPTRTDTSTDRSRTAFGSPEKLPDTGTTR